MITATDAHIMIKPHRPVKALRYGNGRTKDIAKVVLEVERTDRDDTEELAKLFEPTYLGLQDLYWFVKNNIQYQEDPDGVQWIQTPSHLWHTRTGDCKSLTVFICSVLWNMGLDYIIRFSTDNPRSRYVTHVYPVAILPNGKKVIIDTVLGEVERARTGQVRNYFDKEGKKFIEKNSRIRNMTKIYKLGNIGNVQVEQAIEELQKVINTIPDSVINDGPGDVTKMSQGKFERYIMAERMHLMAANSDSDEAAQKYHAAARAIEKGSAHSIGNISNDAMKRDVSRFLKKAALAKRPAFEMPNIMPPHGVSGFIKKALNKIKNWFKKAFQKFMNWLSKGTIKKASPFFLFLFLKKRTTNKIERRRKEQLKTFKWISKTAKYSEKNLLAQMYNGILAQTGKTPQQILNGAASRKVAGPAAAIITLALRAIKVVVDVINFIKKLFKKKSTDTGDVSKDSASDISLLEELPDNSNPGSSSGKGTDGKSRPGHSQTPGNSPRPSDSGGGAGGLAMLLVPLLFALQ